MELNNKELEKPIDRVRLLIKDKELSVSAFEKEIGMSNNSIQQALKRGANLKDETLNNILNSYPKLSAKWLLTGKGSMYEEFKKEDSSEPTGVFISEEVIKNFDRLSKKDMVRYMQLKQKDFEDIPDFQLYKKLLTKDAVIAELLKKLKEK